MYKITPYRQINGVFSDGKHLYTQNMVPGCSVYGENLARQSNIEYRRWEPRRSKLAALIRKGSDIFPFVKNSSILYLGAASGTTVSHLSDIVKDGSIYSVEISRIPFQKLLFLAQQRKNIIPIMGDAAFPERYKHIVPQVNVVYQDIAQRDQLMIFKKNLMYLAKNGIGILMVKARSINVASDPKEIYSKIERDFRSANLEILGKKELFPYEKDHAAIIIKKK